jgi:hypothetical protein
MPPKAQTQRLDKAAQAQAQAFCEIRKENSM